MSHLQPPHHCLQMGLNVPMPNWEEIKLGSHPVPLSNKACDLRQVILTLMTFLVSLLVLLGSS
jgi:hypothetical protein